jgi:prevent-host-death family protein
MDDHKAGNPDRVSVAEAKAHLSDLLVKVEGGRDVLITRRGLPIARLSAVERPKGPPDLSAIDTFRKNIRPAKRSAARMIRRMRDERY